MGDTNNLTLPAPETDIAPVGMIYDTEAQCWRLNYSCRIGGKPRHLRESVYGPKRATQAEAMRCWLKLEERAKDPAGSMAFRDLAARYIADTRPAANIERVIEHITDGIGAVLLRDLAVAGPEWLDTESRRRVRKWRRVGGKLQLCELDRTIRPATLQAYRRYIKTILAHCGRTEYWPKISVGQAIRRARAIEVWEMAALETVVQREYPWFFAAFDAARTCPYRPEDQFAIQRTDDGRPKYTTRKTGRTAYPIVWPGQEGYYHGHGLCFAAPGGASLYSGEAGQGYYSSIWDRVCRLAGVTGVCWYDLKKHAVAYCRQRGISDARIRQAAGWTSLDMLEVYDPDNEAMIRQYDRSVIEQAAPAAVL